MIHRSNASVGEIEVKWIDKGPNEWKFTLTNNPLAKEFIGLVETVRAHQHLNKEVPKSIFKST